MRVIKKAGIAIAMSLTLAMVSPMVLPMAGTSITQAATIKLNKTKADINTGESVTLKMTGIAKDAKVQWSSSKSSVATVSQTGKVTGKAAGTATITATVNKKKYNCTVTVKKDSASKTEISGLSFATPKDWKASKQKISNVDTLVMMPNAAKQQNQMSINVIAQKTGTDAKDLDALKDTLVAVVEQQLEAQFKIKNVDSTTFKSKVGDVLVFSYTTTVEDLEISQNMYYVFMDQYDVQLVATYIGDNVPASLDKIVKGVIDSAKAAK